LVSSTWKKDAQTAKYNAIANLLAAPDAGNSTSSVRICEG
jgi:hypothetical protein